MLRLYLSAWESDIIYLECLERVIYHDDALLIKVQHHCLPVLRFTSNFEQELLKIKGIIVGFCYFWLLMGLEMNSKIKLNHILAKFSSKEIVLGLKCS